MMMRDYVVSLMQVDVERTKDEINRGQRVVQNAIMIRRGALTLKLRRDYGALTLKIDGSSDTSY
jgi:hypothetical protein